MTAHVLGLILAAALVGAVAVAASDAAGFEVQNYYVSAVEALVAPGLFVRVGMGVATFLLAFWTPLPPWLKVGLTVSAPFVLPWGLQVLTGIGVAG